MRWDRLKGEIPTLIGRVISWTLVGAVITVLIAWCCATWSPLRPLTPAVCIPKPGLQWPDVAPSDWPVPTTVYLRKSTGVNVAVLMNSDDSVSGATFNMNRTSAGLPWRALQMVVVAGGGGSGRAVQEDRGAIGLPTIFGRPLVSQQRLLPLMPVAAGFLADAAVWGVVSWLVVRGAVSWRKKRRARRGLCVGCGYPITEFPMCPECGRVARGQARRAARSSCLSRLAVRAAWCVSLGVLTTIGVAWCFAWNTAFAPTTLRSFLLIPSEGMLKGGKWGSITEARAGAGRVMFITRPDWSWRSLTRDENTGDNSLNEQWMRSIVPAWAMDLIPTEAPSAQATDYVCFTSEAYGWPRHALRWRDDDDWHIRFAGPTLLPICAAPAPLSGHAPGARLYSLHSRSGTSGAKAVFLPLEPIWKNFLIDTALYAGGWFALFTLTRWVASRARR